MRVLSADWVLPVADPPLADAAVAVEGGLIAAVGPRAEVLASFAGATEERFAGAVLAPALVNLHTHVEYASYAGFGDGLGFAGWLDLHIERKRRLDPEAMRAIAALGVTACLQSGVGTLVDASFSGDAVKAATAAGVRAVVALEAFGTAQVAAGAADALAGRIAGHGAEAGALVEVAASPHAPYTASLELYERVVADARTHGRRVVTHLAESPHEIEWALRGSGPMARAPVPSPGQHPVSMLADRGLLGPETVVAHAVHVGPEQIAALAASGCAVAHCPRSNALLGCGIAPLRELREAGVRVGLGTDSPASALTLDMFSEMRAAILLARARECDPEALGAAAALRLATADGAAALGRSGELGLLREGAAADVVAVRLDDSAFWPADDPVAALVYAGSPQRVLMTMVAGDVRYRSGDGALARALTGAAPARARMLLSTPGR